MSENKVAIVVIGRNEGTRLVECLRSIAKLKLPFVYVDSGSSDGSVENSKMLAEHFVELSSDLPFSAARARNEGFDFLLNEFPSIEYVQFVDGDCKIEASWLEQATSYLYQNSQCAIVCGLLQEEFPEKSIYNRLCDIEWEQPFGEINACGGIFLIRKLAFEQVAGFNTSLRAGEEPEMCDRLKSKNWKIFRIDSKMALHDADINSLKSYLVRIKRAGYASLARFLLDRRRNFKEVVRILVWGFILPAVCMVSIFFNSMATKFILLIFFLQMVRVLVRLPRGHRFSVCLLYSFFIVFGKIVEMVGLIDSLIKMYSKKHLNLYGIPGK